MTGPAPTKRTRMMYHWEPRVAYRGVGEWNHR